MGGVIGFASKQDGRFYSEMPTAVWLDAGGTGVAHRNYKGTCGSY